MTTPPPAAHDHWEELAAGYALDALEPDEETAFLGHLETCERCRAVLDDHAFVAAQLGALAEDSGLTAPSWSTIRSGVVGAGAPPSGSGTAPAAAPVAVLDEHRTRRRPWTSHSRILGAAAAAVLIAGAGTAAWQLASGTNGPAQPAAVTACARQAGCHVVRLDGTAVVLASGNTARLVPTSLQPAERGHVYALWQLPRDGSPMLVSLVPSMTRNVPGPPAAMRLPYADTAAFAISSEPTGTIPTHPTDVVATGTARA